MKEAVYIENHGCQMNVADAERAASRLRSAGYAVTAKLEQADLVIFNTCSVRERAAQKVFNRIGEVRRDNKNRTFKIGIMGCVAQLEGGAIFEQTPAVDLVVGTRALERLPQLAERVLSGEKQTLDIGEREAVANYLDVSNVERHSKHVAFVPIIEGCNKFCTYCIVPYSRGREQSRSAVEILQEVRTLLEQGYQEVHLIGQNVNSYRPRTEDGLECIKGARPFSRLLRAVAGTGMQRIKFTTSFPRDFHTDIVSALDEHENLCNWVHLPVQSGSDNILRRMRRGYTVRDYLERVGDIKGARRRLALTTDIIIGFPGETAADFQETMRLVEHCQYDGIYMFKYSKRPGTPAAALLDDVHNEEKKERFLALEDLQRQIQSKLYSEYVGQTLNVLVEGQSAKSEADMTGHSTCQKVINFKGNANLLGQIKRVEITQAKANSLYGQLAS